MSPKTLAAIGLAILVCSAGCSKPSPDELFAKGNEYFAQDKIPEAIVQFRLAVQADPTRADVRVKLAEAYLRQRDGGAALRETVAAADLLPNDAATQLKAGNLLLLVSNFEDAKARAEKVLALDPANVEALILQGNALAGLKDLDGALAEYQEALALRPAEDQIYASIGAIQYSRGQVKEAEATFRKAIDVAPRSVNARMALAGFLWASQRQSEAEALFKEALVLEPTNLVANRTLGAFYMATGRAPAAEPFFKTIAETTKSDEAQLSLADYYVVIRRADDAKAILTPLSQKPASFGPASLRLAAIEAGRNNRAGATRIVNEVLAKTPKYGPARIVNIRLLLADKREDEAMEAAKSVIKDEPRSLWAAEANFLAGSIEAANDRTDDALKYLTEALRIQPESVPVASALARLHFRLGNIDKATTFAQQVLVARPRDVTARSVLVRVDLARNDLTKASAGLAALDKEFPGSAPVLNLTAAREVVAGRLDSARALYSKVLEGSPSDLEALQGLIIVDLRSGRAKEATERAEDALKRLPPAADLLVIAARAHGAAGNHPRAEELLRQAIEREPARLGAYSMLGQLYVQQKRLTDARDQYQELLKRNPQSVPINTILGMVQEARGDSPAAEQQYQATLNIDPTAAVAANNLAWIYVASNRNLDQALQLAQTAARGLPEEPHVNDTLGWIYYRKGMFSQAVRHLELSVARDASDPVSHYHLGMAYIQAGEDLKARKSLQKALSMSGTFEGVAEARKALADLPR